LQHEPAKNLVSQMLAKQLFREARRLGRTDGLRQLLVVDEAHNVAPRNPDYQSVLDQIAIENRKYGQGLLVATTSPSQLSEALLRNASTRICHQLDDGRDIDLVLRFMVNRLEADRFISDIRLLGIGEAVIQAPNERDGLPIKVRVDCLRRA
jgi:DNA helicase HerA-like ATPase